MNIPIQKPLYTLPEKPVHPSALAPRRQLAADLHLKANAWNEIKALMEANTKVLIIAGQLPADKSTDRRLEDFSQHLHIPIVTQITSNLHGIPNAMQHAESYIQKQRSLCPTLLISFGGPLLSQNLKNFFRTTYVQSRIQAHIVVSADRAIPPDTLQSMTHHAAMTPSIFFEEAVPSNCLVISQVKGVGFIFCGRIKKQNTLMLKPKHTQYNKLPFGSLYTTQALFEENS